MQLVQTKSLRASALLTALVIAGAGSLVACGTYGVSSSASQQPQDASLEPASVQESQRSSSLKGDQNPQFFVGTYDEIVGPSSPNAPQDQAVQRTLGKPVDSKPSALGADAPPRIEVDFSQFRQLLLPDDIPPIYDPLLVPGKSAGLGPRGLVIGVSINGQSRAYPVSILALREMVNDVVGGVPILVTW